MCMGVQSVLSKSSGMKSDKIQRMIGQVFLTLTEFVWNFALLVSVLSLWRQSCLVGFVGCRLMSSWLNFLWKWSEFLFSVIGYS